MSLSLLFGHDAAVADWVARRISHVGSGEAFGPCAAIGVLNNAGTLIGGVVYHNYLPATGNIELSFAADTPRWLNREIICGLLRYPYSQLKVIRCTAITPRRVTSARRFLEKFGFKREGCVRFGFGNDHAIISGLLAREWEESRFNTERNVRQRRPALDGKESSISAAAA